MANIKPYTDEIANAVYGEEVRSSIINALNKVNDDNNSYQDIKNQIVASKDDVNEAVAEFDAKVASAQDATTALIDATSKGNTAKSALDSAITSANTARTNLVSATTSANNAESTLKSATSTAQTATASQNLTRPNIEQMAKNRGEGWHSFGIKTASMEQLLMIVEMGMMNLQTAIGQGVVNLLWTISMI